MTKTVIIVGGGIAGLAAARELAGQGIITTLLEAKSRFGGRIHTIHEGSLPIELGAEFIHGRNRSLLKAIKDAGLSTSRVAFNRNLAEDGRLKRTDIWQIIGNTIGSIDLQKPDCSIAEFLAREPLDDRTRRIVRSYAEGFDAAHAERISAHSLLKAQISAGKMEGDWQGRVDDGYSALVGYMARDAAAKGAKLIRGARVKQIRWKPGSVEVSWQEGRKTCRATADAVLLTLPLGVWKAGIVRITPSLPEKQMAVRELEFGNALRVNLVFQEHWWPKAGDGFVHALDQPVPTWWSNPRGPILTGWAGGSRADNLLSLSPQRLKTLCLESLGRIFSESPTKLRKRLVAVYHHRWENDPDIRGSYSYIPVNGLDLPKVLAAPVADTLFFAGEATVADAQMGTVFGALETGLRAVREIARALR